MIILHGIFCHGGMPNYKSYNKERTEKICSICKIMQILTNYRVREKKNGRGKGKFYNSICRSCETFKVDAYRTMTKNGIAAEILRRKKHECRVHNIPFDLSKEWILDRLEKINWKCELTGLEMRSLKLSSDEKYTGFQLDSISMDRIDPNGGYIKSNVRFVLNQINMFKQNGTDERMYLLAQALLKYRKDNEI